MKSWLKIDKDRLTIFTDAIVAIIMTLLVLDLKVPSVSHENNETLACELQKELPHFVGFVISFSMIVLIWFSHHSLMRTLREANNVFALLNFLFIGCVATLPFSTALVSEYPYESIAVFILATNMFLMNAFLASMFIYMFKNNMHQPDVLPEWHARLKQKMSYAGSASLILSMILSWFFPILALYLIVLVPVMHCIPLREKRKSQK